MRIYVKPRIHISLISMHDGGYRKNGGIGFAIEEPKGVLDFSASDNFTFTDNRSVRLGEIETEGLLSSLMQVQSLLCLDKSISITFSGGLLTHVGMGSGTALRLACLEALLLINGRSIGQEDLVSLSKRGGASGVGVHTYFSGQFVFDLGASNDGKAFTPSSLAETVERPLLLDSVDFPDWTIGVCIPKHVPPKTQADESEFFKKSCPIQETQSWETLFHCLFGVYASVREKDVQTFARSIRVIQNCEWKRLERKEYGDELFEVERRLYEFGATCVGMSSLGPMLYFLASEYNYTNIVSQLKDSGCSVFLTKASNSGREIIF